MTNLPEPSSQLSKPLLICCNHRTPWELFWEGHCLKFQSCLPVFIRIVLQTLMWSHCHNPALLKAQKWHCLLWTKIDNSLWQAAKEKYTSSWVLPKVWILKENETKQTKQRVFWDLSFSSSKRKAKRPSQVTSLGLPFTSNMGIHLKGKLAQWENYWIYSLKDWIYHLAIMPPTYAAMCKHFKILGLSYSICKM